MIIRLSILAIFLSLLVTSTGYSQGFDPDPPYDMSPIEAYSIYYDSYQGGDYEMARMYGEWMLEAQPRELEGHDGFSLENQFRRMVTVYAELAENESDPSDQAEFYESALWIFDQIDDLFEDEMDAYEWTLREGRFYQEHYSDLDQNLEDAFDRYLEAWQMDPERFANEGDGYYAGILLDHMVSEGDSDRALELIESVEPHASPELAATIDEARGNLYDDPEERADFLEGQLADADAGEQESLLDELAELYDQMGDREAAYDAAVRLHELNPDFENSRAVAELALSDAEYQTAADYLDQALDQSPNDQERSEVARQLSDAYQNLDDLQSARDYARIAIDADPENGEAYLRMASVYASVISDCTSGRDLEREDRTVYWLVLDYLDRAQEADPAVSSTAQQRKESYEAVMPSTEDKFFMDWEEGDPFHIDGEIDDCYAWIDEETQVR